MGEESEIAMASADRNLTQKVAKILNESRTSYATHNRKLKELATIRSKLSSSESDEDSSSSSVRRFSSVFFKTLPPLFIAAQRRTAAAERVVRFVAEFACLCSNNSDGDSDCDEFLEEFLKFLMVGSVAANRNARFRACQIISEIILRLPDEMEVADELWDDVIDCMMLSGTFAVRSLSRFVNDPESSDILVLLLEVLPLEQNPEVRKTIVLSLPPSNATTQAIIDCTLDVNESVCKAA